MTKIVSKPAAPVTGIKIGVTIQKYNLLRSLKTSYALRSRERNSRDVRCHFITLTKLSKNKWAHDSPGNRTTPRNSRVSQVCSTGGSEESYILATPQNPSSDLLDELCRAFYCTASRNLVKRFAEVTESLGLYPSAKTCQRVDISPPNDFLESGFSTRKK